MKNVLVVIPAFNEQETIQTAIKEIKRIANKSKTFDISALVINDGSTDLTEAKAKEASYLVVSLPINLGIGGAVQTGYKYAMANDYDIVVQYDGDGQHCVDDILFLVDTLIDHKVNIVIGSRFIEKTDYRPSLARKLGMLFSEKLLYLVTGKVVKDTTSGFRALDKKAIELFSTDYPEMFAGVIPLVIAFRNGLSYKEVKSKFKYRVVGKSSINVYKSFFYPIKVSLAVFSIVLRMKGSEK